MRELKFRGWYKTEGKMVDMFKISPLALNDAMNTQLAMLDIQGLFLPLGMPELVLMQFTGLLDKSGKEIYEGDVVKEGGRLSTVRFSKSYARFELETPTGRAGLYGFYGEIIGNVYENPELLIQRGIG